MCSVEVSPHAFTHLYQQLLDNKARAALCNNLVDHDHLATAVEVAQGIRDDSAKVKAFGIVVAAQARAGNRAAAQATALTAYQIAQGVMEGYIARNLSRDFAFLAAVVPLAQVGELDTATRIVQGTQLRAFIPEYRVGLQAARGDCVRRLPKYD